MKGGLFVPKDKETEAFLEYCGKGIISEIGSGGYSRVLKIEIPDTSTLKHKFTNMRYNNYKTDCKYLCLKFCIVSDRKSYSAGVRAVTADDFANEINIQTDIFFKTITYLQPLCPGIVFTDILDGTKHKAILETFLNTFSNETDVIQMITFVLGPKPTGQTYANEPKLGIICMEMLNSEPLYDMINKPEIKKYPNLVNNILNASRYVLLKLALDTGYNHADFHKDNILIAENDSYFDNPNFKYQPIILDFGRTIKIPPNVLREIKTLVNEKNYVDALGYLCDTKTSNEFVSDSEHNAVYGWVCGSYRYGNTCKPKGLVRSLSCDQPDINEKIDAFFALSEAAIDKNITVFNEKHAAQPDIYPLLPISNQLKNNLFSGFFGGKRNRRNKKRYKINKSKKRKSKTRTKTRRI